MTPGAHNFDFELEVAAVVGKGGEEPDRGRGDDVVIGYCVLNDWSGRDVQHDEMKLSMGPVKGKSTATTLGPYLATRDERPTPRARFRLTDEPDCEREGSGTDDISGRTSVPRDCVGDGRHRLHP